MIRLTRAIPERIRRGQDDALYNSDVYFTLLCIIPKESLNAGE